MISRNSLSRIRNVLEVDRWVKLEAFQADFSGNFYTLKIKIYEHVKMFNQNRKCDVKDP